MSGGYEIDIQCALFLNFKHFTGKACGGDLTPLISPADLVVLAEQAFEMTAGKKYGP